MSKRDYYEVLGVTSSASEEDIRKAYKKAAVKFHPDRNPNNPEAEASFKEATEAYSILSDATKRNAYDRFGHAGVESQGYANQDMGDVFSHFQDLFSDFFGMGGNGRSSRQRSSRGQDIRVESQLTLKEAFTGCKKEVRIRGAVPCETCEGSGAAKGSKAETCRRCQGQGQVGTQRGFIMFSTTCPDCQGQGQVVKDPCGDCRGQGSVTKERTVMVTFPAGVDSGVRLRVSGQGMPGAQGAPSGDLYVDVAVRNDERYERDGADLIVREFIAFSEAALGTELSVELPDESQVRVEVPKGTQPGTVLTLRGKGIPRLDRRANGDLHVFVSVIVPKKLSRKAKKLLAELDAELAN